MAEQTSPKWFRVAVNLAGLGIVVHESFLDRPRWLVMVVCLVMMGVVGPDVLDSIIPGRSIRQDEHTDGKKR